MNFADFEVTNIDELKELWYTVMRYLKANHNKQPRLVITIKEFVQGRTINQNRALFGVAYETIRKQSGHEKTELHRHFCGEFFGWIEYIHNGQHHERPVRTTTTDEDGREDIIGTLDFANFYTFIQDRCAMADPPVIIPDPDPRWREKLAAEAAKEKKACSN